MERDAVRRHEVYPAEAVEMDLTGADIPEPHVEEVGVNLGHPARNCFVALCELVERTRSRSEHRMNSSATFVRRTNVRKSPLAFEVGQTHTPNSTKV